MRRTSVLAIEHDISFGEADLPVASPTLGLSATGALVYNSVMARFLPAALLVALAIFLPSSADAKTTWLCKPGIRNNPCEPGLGTTVFSPAGKRLGVKNAKRDSPRRIDCFYVYPTVSDQQTDLANLHKDPEVRSIALYQAARWSQRCRVFAPMYRQITIKGLQTTQVFVSKPGYADVRAAWREYLRKYNHGRGVVFIGHSQGSFTLRELIAKEVDPKPAVRRKLVSALLLGGDVLVKKGGDSGGDFKHIKACRRPGQVGCVLAWSTYGEQPPSNSVFGRTAQKGKQVLCTNPAALGGGSGKVDAVYPTRPFAPGTLIAAGIAILGYPLPSASTPWISVPGSFRAHCSSAGGANVLQVKPLSGAPTLKPSPDATWGLHLTDENIALGNLLAIVKSQAAAYARRG
jgi:hypothetical protein